MQQELVIEYQSTYVCLDKLAASLSMNARIKGKGVMTNGVVHFKFSACRMLFAACGTREALLGLVTQMANFHDLMAVAFR